MTETNPVTFPAHYQFSGVMREVRDVIRDRTVVYLDNDFPAEGIYDYDNAIKYILRAPAKNGIEDLKKAKCCIDSLIGILEADGVIDFDVEEVLYSEECDGEKGNDEYELPAFFDPDVMADVIVRMREAIQDKREEMAYYVMNTGMLPDPPCDHLNGLRSPTFDE